MSGDVDRKNPLVNGLFGEGPPESRSGGRDSERLDDQDDHERWLRDNVPPHHG